MPKTILLLITTVTRPRLPLQSSSMVIMAAVVCSWCSCLASWSLSNQELLAPGISSADCLGDPTGRRGSAAPPELHRPSLARATAMGSSSRSANSGATFTSANTLTCTPQGTAGFSSLRQIAYAEPAFSPPEVRFTVLWRDELDVSRPEATTPQIHCSV